MSYVLCWEALARSSMSDQPMVKVALKDEAGGLETLWATPVGEGRFRLENSPFCACRVSFLDVVEALPADDGLLQIGGSACSSVPLSWKMWPGMAFLTRGGTRWRVDPPPPPLPTTLPWRARAEPGYLAQPRPGRRRCVL